MNFKDLFHDFKLMKAYFIFVLVLFLAGIVLGWLNTDRFSGFLEQQLHSFQNINSFIESKENPHLWLFILIWLNNFAKAAIVVFLGLIFSVIPIFMLISNGIILGYVLSIQPNDALWSTIFNGILPHGVIEIPAICIACAYGIKLGVQLMKVMVHLVIPSANQYAWGELKGTLRKTKTLVVFLFICFTLAALIESTVTLWLIERAS
jgi:stage II sporulation protein M